MSLAHRSLVLDTGFIFGAFIGYLSSAPQILQKQYGLGDLFPLYFAANAAAMGIGSFLNSRLVLRFGMRALTCAALVLMSVISGVFAVLALTAGGHPALWILMAFFIGTIFCFGAIYANGNALAIEPLGHIAGTASSVIGSVSLLISIVFGTVIGQSYDGSVIPVAVGFLAMGIAALLAMVWVERSRPDDIRNPVER